MAVVTPDLLQAIYTNLRALWENQFLAAQQGDSIRSQIAMEVPSGTLQETYAWFNTVPKMREWIGERQISSLTPSNYTIVNKDWEDTIAVDRNTIEDDRLGQIMPRVSQLAIEAVRSQEELCISTLASGLTALCHDGQYFFDTDHVTPGAEYQTNQSNKLTGTGVTLDQLRTDFGVAMAAMRNFKDDRGRPMNLRPTHMLVPPALEGVTRQLLTSEALPTGAGMQAANPWRNVVQPLINGYLTDPSDWYLLCCDQPVKPMVFQMRRAVQFNRLDNPEQNEAAFMRKQYLYGVDGRWNAGFGFWFMAVLTTNV